MKKWLYERRQGQIGKNAGKHIKNTNWKKAGPSSSNLKELANFPH